MTTQTQGVLRRAEALAQSTRAWLAGDPDAHTVHACRAHLAALVGCDDALRTMLRLAPSGRYRDRLVAVEDDLDDLAETIALGLSPQFRVEIEAAMQEAATAMQKAGIPLPVTFAGRDRGR